MPEKKRRKRRKQAAADATPPKEYMPDPENVVAEKELVSPSGKRYRVLVTNELDPYETDEEKPE